MQAGVGFDSCGRENVRWVGELVGYECEYTTERALVIMRAVREYDAVVSFHCHDLDVVDQHTGGSNSNLTEGAYIR